MARGHSIYHYSTRADYEPVIADVAKELAVKYTVNEWRLEPDHRVYLSPLDAPEFDVFKWGRSPGVMLFVLPKGCELPFTHRQERQSAEKYGFSPITLVKVPNYRWIIFHPSGFHKSEQFGEGLIQGWLSTNAEHPDSLAIFNAFKKSIKKRFEYLKGCGAYVGKEAAEYMDKGGRLTQDLRSPVIGDCKRMPVSA